MMIECATCTTANSLDSGFCKKCGVALSIEEIQESKQKLGETLAEGYRLFNDGRTEDAMLIAQMASETDPSMTAALSLKGMCHERLHQIAEALDAYEKVLVLDPDAALEKIKVNQLRNLLASVIENPGPNRRLLALASAAAVVAFISIGALVATLKVPPQDQVQQPTLVAQNEPTPKAEGFEIEEPPQKVETAPPITQTPPQTPPQIVQQPQAAPAPVILDVAPNNSGILPNISSGQLSGSINPQREPVKPANDTPKPPVAPQNGDGDPDPVVTLPQGPKVPPPVYNVEISTNQPARGAALSGTEPISNSGNGLKALMETATNQYLRNDYRAAAQSYEKALAAGGSQAIINERLASCYRWLGLKSDAKDAYARAIQAYEADLKSGSGNSARTRSALDACRQALKVLDGG